MNTLILGIGLLSAQSAFELPTFELAEVKQQVRAQVMEDVNSMALAIQAAIRDGIDASSAVFVHSATANSADEQLVDTDVDEDDSVASDVTVTAQSH